VVVVPGQYVEMITNGGQRLRLPLDTVMRLHKHGTAGRWRIVYAPVDDLDGLRIEEEVDFTDEAHSTFRFLRCRSTRWAGSGTGCRSPPGLAVEARRRGLRRAGDPAGR
jgi:hypothetical protein